MLFKKYLLIVSVLFFSLFSFSQGTFKLKKGDKQDKIRFKLINSLIVFPVEVNGVELSFLLDTGVSKPIIFNFLNITDTLQIKNTEKILLRGLGDGDYIEAYKSQLNVFKIGNAYNVNQDLYVVFDPSLNFAPRLGVPIHGIIGYDIFKDFVVEINYSKKFLRLTNQEDFNIKKYKKYKKLGLEFFNRKPYINALVSDNSKSKPVKLLIDTGGSDALWLFEDSKTGILPSNNYFNDFLGKGLSGSIYGKRSKVDELLIAGNKFKHVNVAYPDSVSIRGARNKFGRNGSVSGEILKRFNHVFNYNNSILLLKKNSNFKLPFNYNKSGIVLEHNGVRLVKESQVGFNNIARNQSDDTFSKTRIVLESSFEYFLSPAYTIVELRKDSPGYLAGLKLGDVIVQINNRDTHKLSLQEVMQEFFDKNGKLIRLKVDRNGEYLNFKFRLEDILKKPR